MIITKQPHQLENANALKDWLGIAAAARYMRRCGWDVEVTLYWLLGRRR